MGIFDFFKSNKKDKLFKTYYENGQLEKEGAKKDGKQEGLWKTYHENGQLELEENFKDGERDGLCKYYHENGQLKEEGNAKDGEQEGLWKSYHENGQLRGEGNYKEGKQEGLWKYYHENGQLKEEGNFKDGEREGLWKTYHENGQLELEGNCKDGEQEGLRKTYHENGQLESEGDFKDGKPEGLWKEYYENGQLVDEGNNKDDKKEGLWKSYHENGQLRLESNWKDGKQEGLWKSYLENGQLKSEGDWKDGERDGLWKFYHENGQLEEEVNFKDGELIEKDGNLNTKGSSNESDNQEALVDFMLEFSKLKNSLEKSPNLNKIFDEFTYAIRNGHTVREYLEQSDSFSAFETINILILGFTKIKDSIYKMLEKYEDSEFRLDFNALNEAIDILKKESKNNNNLFDQELEKINSQFELVLKSKNNEDYPPPFWYDIVKERAIYMEQDTNKKTLSEVQSEWVWMHADEYKNKYSSYSKNDIIDAMSLRIKRFGFIYKAMLNFEKKLNALAKENNISSFSYLDQFKLDMSSAYASLFGTINYALSSGMTNNDISKLYTDFVYDKVIIDGTNPFVNLGTTQEDARNIIKDNLNIDIDNIKTKQIKVHQKDSKEAEETTEKKHVNFDKEYNELDELILDEDFKDWHEDYMFLKLVYEKIKTAKIQNDIQLNSFIKERLKKLTTSELTSKMVNFRSLENIIGKELSGWGDTNNTRFEGYIDVEQYHTIVTRSYQIGTEVMIDFVTKGDG
jgi:antitoxin component YwqK of YwqJK toxin-antitoxin module